MVVGIRVRVMRLRVMGSGDHVVGVDGMVRDDVSAVAVGSEVGGRYALTRKEIALNYDLSLNRQCHNLHYTSKIFAFNYL